MRLHLQEWTARPLPLKRTNRGFAVFTNNQTLYRCVYMHLRPQTFGCLITVAVAVWKIWCLAS